MLSILSEIKKLRGYDAPLSVDLNNTNRYRVIINETDGTKTAYYFSAPIYNNISKKLLSMKFDADDNKINYVGSNTKIKFSDKATLENEYGSFSVSLNNNVIFINEQELHSGKNKIFPTTNGFAYLAYCSKNSPISFEIETSVPFLNVRSNEKYFSLMRDKFEPFLTISCIGSSEPNKTIVAPAKIQYDKLTDRNYKIYVTPCTPICEFVLIEINMYEPKLFQDTTVESNTPTENNAFGSIAFIGNTKEFGEQWLYSRPNFTVLSELLDKRIQKIRFHIPTLNYSNVTLTGYSISSRFCSFGSTWENKIPLKDVIANSYVTEGYQHFDITKPLTNKEQMLERSEGLILRSKIKNNGFSVISTGDSYYAPQILEINFK